MPTRRRAVLILATLMLLALASFWAALAVGSIAVAPGDIIAGLLGREAPGADIINELRLSRAPSASGSSRPSPPRAHGAPRPRPRAPTSLMNCVCPGRWPASLAAACWRWLVR